MLKTLKRLFNAPPPVFTSAWMVSGNEATQFGEHVSICYLENNVGRGLSAGSRDISQLAGLTLHQTACRLSLSALPKVPADYVVKLDGSIYCLRPMEEWCWHAQGLSKTTLGVEIECRVPGLIGDASTFWRSTKEIALGKKMIDVQIKPTEEQLNSARKLCGFLLSNIAERQGLPIEGRLAIYAHRQAHSSRRSDPGQQLWAEIAERVSDVGRTRCVDTFVYKTGKALPDQWTGRNNGIKY